MTSKQPRLLSYSEIETAMTCWARWDYAYGGRLAGSTLKARQTAAILSDGRAWGAAVAAWHANANQLLAPFIAHEALNASYDQDEREMAERGFLMDRESRMVAQARLAGMLDHYMATTTPLANLTRLEAEILVPVPSRTGERVSTRYRFLCYLDGYTDDDGQRWLVEFKLRNRLTPFALIQKQRQHRWGAWALAQTGVRPLGAIVDERLNELPHEPRILKNGKPSHDKAQLITPEAYTEACLDRGEAPKTETYEALRARAWQQRHPLVLRDSEIDAAGQELVSAAKLIRDLDSGELEPIRNASSMHCGGCRFRDVCAEPTDQLFVDTLFERGVPKRDRDPMERTRG